MFDVLDGLRLEKQEGEDFCDSMLSHEVNSRHKSITSVMSHRFN